MSRFSPKIWTARRKQHENLQLGLYGSLLTLIDVNPLLFHMSRIPGLLELLVPTVRYWK